MTENQGAQDAEHMDLFPGFATARPPGDGLSLHARIGGSGPAVALLHGYPQTHAAWAKVAPALAEHATVVVLDLRGYGRSDVPTPDADHETSSKRRMARDVVAAMASLGHERFAVLGHDRGARVAYRLALDHPQVVTRVGIVEIVPTLELWENFGAETALHAYHWPFLAQPHPLPERLIAADRAWYLEWTLSQWSKSKSLDAFDPRALADYRRAFVNPARLRAMCEDYRAGATIDRRHDAEDRAAGRKIQAPLRVLGSGRGFAAHAGDVGEVWRRWAVDVSTASADAGHFIAEEAPDAVIDAFGAFFAEADDAPTPSVAVAT